MGGTACAFPRGCVGLCAQVSAAEVGFVTLSSLSVCPLNDHISPPTATTLVQATVNSCWHYCHNLLTGLSVPAPAPLEPIKLDHITPLFTRY